MMRLMIKRLFPLLLLGISSGYGQGLTERDFSSWYWLQLKYKLSKKTNLQFQCQYRMNHNATEFDKTNLFLSVDRRLAKGLTGELLYQFSTDHHADQHTLYGGLTYKLKLVFFDVFVRTALQHKRDYFSGIYALDKPYTEWRNRIRLSVPVGASWSFSASTEPYFLMSPVKHQFSRIRNVFMTTWDVNNFQSLSLFYLIEPELNPARVRHTDYVAGLTLQIKVPRKKKEFKHFFDYHKSEKEKDKDRKDSFQ